MSIQEQNLTEALKIGMIDWFQYLEAVRKLSRQTS